MRWTSTLLSLLSACHLGTAQRAGSRRASVHSDSPLVPRAVSGCVDHAKMGQRLLFAHYMAMGTPPDGKYITDIRTAAQSGIHALALNFGGWTSEFQRWEGVLDTIYFETAKYNALGETCPIKLFISFDMTSVKDPAMIVRLSLKYQDHPAQLYVDGNKMMVSSFEDDFVNVNAFDWKKAVLDKIKAGLTGAELYFMPGSVVKDPKKLFSRANTNGIFTWLHPSTSVADEAALDKAFAAQASSTGKDWCVGVAPWFFKHLEGYNWSNKQDEQIFVPRLQNVLKLKPRFIELLTWNDFGESSYLGQNDPNAYTTIKYAQWSHTGFLGIAKIFADTMASGKTEVDMSTTKEQVFLIYRTQPFKTPGSNDPIGVPKDGNLKDEIFVASFLAKSAQVTLTNGGKTTTFTAPVGVSLRGVPFKTGSVALDVKRGSTSFISKKGPSIVSQHKIYNANAVAI